MAVAEGDHAVEVALHQQLHGSGGEFGGEETIEWGRSAAALEVAEDRVAGFQAGEFFNLFGEDRRDAAAGEDADAFDASHPRSLSQTGDAEK